MNSPSDAKLFFFMPRQWNADDADSTDGTRISVNPFNPQHRWSIIATWKLWTLYSNEPNSLTGICALDRCSG